MPATFYEKIIDGKPVDIFRFTFAHGDVFEARAQEGDKRLHAIAWQTYQAEKARASQPAAEQKRDEQAAANPDDKTEAGPESGGDDDTADPGEKILRQRERAAGRRPKK